MPRTPEQLRAIQCVDVSRVCVDAGAGSGKTSVLIERIVNLLELGLATLDEIVAITFTDMAAAEMKERLKKACHDKAPQSDSKKMDSWRDIERRAPMARIQTIHSFCGAILRQNAISLGLDPDFAVMAEAECSLLRSETVLDTVRELLSKQDPVAMCVATEVGINNLLGILESMLLKAAVIERFQRKNTSVNSTHELRSLWSEIVSQEHEKLLRELASSKTPGKYCKRLEKFEGLCTKETDKREQARLEMIAALSGMTPEANYKATVKALEAISSVNLRGARKDNWSSEEIYDELAEAQEQIKKLAKNFLLADAVEETEEKSATLSLDLFTLYSMAADALKKAKAERNAIDFDDHMAKVLNILRNDKEVLERTARSIKFLLIDEFQDTDFDQYEIATLLAEAKGGPKLFIVGDAKQSIYSFRGAEVEVFSEAQESSSEVIRLNDNFRSVPDVLDFANDFFAGTDLLHAVAPDYAGLARLKPNRSRIGEARVEFLVPDPLEGANVEEYRKLEAGLIAGRLLQMCQGPDAAKVQEKDGTERTANFGDVAILLRSMGDVYIYESALRDLGIPYAVEAGAGFFQKQEVKDMLNVLELLANKWNEAALLGFLRSPMVGLSDDTLFAMCSQGSLANAFFADHIPQDFQQADLLQNARSLFANLEQNTHRPLPEFLNYLLERTGYEAVLLTQYLGTRKAANVRKLIDLAHDFSRSPRPSLRAFTKYVRDVAQNKIREGEAPPLSSDLGEVSIMTVHKSKGLEFNIVVLPDTSRGMSGKNRDGVELDPVLGLGIKATDDSGKAKPPVVLEMIKMKKGELEKAESGRLLYVAMTRARDWLLIAGSPNAKGNSWFESLNEQYALVERSDRETIDGDRWSAVVRRKQVDAAPEKKSIPEPDSIDLKTLIKRTGRVVAHDSTRRTFSVTELLDAAFDHKLVASRKRTKRPNLLGGDAATRGTILHRVFEMWDFKSPVAPLIDDILRKEWPGLWHAVKDKTLAEDLEGVAESFGKTDLAIKLSKQEGAIHEVQFLLRIGGALLNGTIDVLFADNSIVDYKTGKAPAENMRKHSLQIQLYAAAIRNLTGDQVPAAHVCFVDISEVCEIDVSDAAIEKALEIANAAIKKLRTHDSAVNE